MSKLPAQCKKCGVFFDLSYDLDEVDAGFVWSLAGKLSLLGKKTALCWECRN